MKNLCIELMCGSEADDGSRGEPLLSASAIAGLANAPSRKTLQAWKKEEVNGGAAAHAPINHDRRSILDEAQKELLCGFLLARLRRGRVVNPEEVLYFVSSLFQKTPSTRWAWDYLDGIGFSKHESRAQLKPSKDHEPPARIDCLGRRQPSGPP